LISEKNKKIKSEVNVERFFRAVKGFIILETGLEIRNILCLFTGVR